MQNLDDALALVTTANAVNWFQYGSDTYVVFNDATGGFGTADNLVKLTGTIDLTNATVAVGVLSLA